MSRKNRRDEDRQKKRLRRRGWEDSREERRKYCNYLEYRMARLLKDHGIRFEYSKKFDTVDEHGDANHREVDFWLEKPIEVFWCDYPVQAIEVKGGKLDKRCWQQKRELKNAGVTTFIATSVYITFWEREGFLRENGLYGRNKRRE